MTRGVGKGMVEIGGVQQCGYTGKERKRKGGEFISTRQLFSGGCAYDLGDK